MSEYYPLQPFRIRQQKALRQLISAYPLATLISGSQMTKDISLIPLMVDERVDSQLILTGHIDRNNPQAGKLMPGDCVAFVFNGPDAYASPDIYDDAQLPGWLYMMVKGAGTIARLIEGDELIDVLCESSWRFGGARQAFCLEKDDPRFGEFIDGIVGFEIEISDIEGIAKLAQDKGPDHTKKACRFLAGLTNSELPQFLEQMLEGSAHPAA